MLHFMRLVVIFIMTLAVLYNALTFYMRTCQRWRLKRLWQHERPALDQATFVKRRMAEFEDSFKRKLAHLVYVTPPSAIVLIIYVINFM
ncbi:hypothetical protein B0H98_101706 [Vreelandella songnenensis]|uniref:Uncharacterized protein n=1 Tax=Vreelandella songnenensis TaxID=1176243 RepID=A0A2T0V9A1_9GAMM|nr:hypothetical protein [Halomonas songnenensis]PRY66711.1 hypothetical protein B0H98_101706 [Halomonas songnenensis]